MNDSLSTAIRQSVDAAVSGPADGVQLLHQVTARQSQGRRGRRVAAVACAAAAVVGIAAGVAVLLPTRAHHAATPASGHLLAAAAIPADAVRVGTARVTGALIDPSDPRFLILSVDGATEVPQSDPCWEGYRASTTETARAVTVTVERLHRRPVAGTPIVCAGTGGTRNLGVELTDPAGPRSVHDRVSGASLRPFDGAELLRPSFLPTGYHETSAPGVGADGSWLRFYAGPAAPITIKQTLGDAAGPPQPDATVERRATVAGAAATVYVVRSTAGPDRRTVVWTTGGQTVAVESSRLSQAIGPAATDELMLVAAGLTSSCGTRHGCGVQDLAGTQRPTSGVTPATPPPNTLRWAYSGRLPTDGRDTIDTRAYAAWAKAVGRLPAEIGAAGPLWAGTLPDDDTVVVVQAWTLSGGQTHTITYAEGTGSAGRIVSDLVLNPASDQFTVTVPGPRTTWRIVLRPSGAHITKGP
ncbi:MAG: hypothetical protein JWO88_3938 [Frankiales bacterium]|nr:hypothetical protein [Frankiales bacterium]